MLGLTGDQGDGSFPEFIVYLQSALRVEDAIFRMTRERAVIHLSDLDRERAQDVFQRLLSDFSDEFPSMTEPRFEVRYFDVKPGSENARVKDVLTEIFAPQMLQ